MHKERILALADHVECLKPFNEPEARVKRILNDPADEALRCIAGTDKDSMQGD